MGHQPTCDQCGLEQTADRPPFGMCSSCKTAWYCSQGCQRKHWSVHKPICRRVTRRATSAAREGLILATLPLPSPSLKGGTTQCILYPGLKDRILSQPGFPQRIPEPKSPAHRLGPVPGAGIGMYATRAIAAGELIVTERPLLVAPGTYNSPRQRDDTIAAALERMSEDDRAAYTALSNPCDAAVPPLFAIWKTNNYDQTHDLRPAAPEMAADTQRPMTIIGKLTSRINHSCSPNATIAWHIASLALFVTAVRDIPAGAEITMRYCEPLLPSAERQQFLRANYGFTCACAACMDHAASDARRAGIMQHGYLLEDRAATLARWIGDATLRDDHLTAPLRAMLALIAEEGVQDAGIHPMALRLLVDAHAACGDAERLAEYAARFAVAGAGAIYVPPRRRQAMVRDLSRPGLYPFWNKRVEYRGPSAARG